MRLCVRKQAELWMSSTDTVPCVLATWQTATVQDGPFLRQFDKTLAITMIWMNVRKTTNIFLFILHSKYQICLILDLANQLLCVISELRIKQLKPRHLELTMIICKSKKVQELKWPTNKQNSDSVIFHINASLSSHCSSGNQLYLLDESWQKTSSTIFIIF